MRYDEWRSVAEWIGFYACEMKGVNNTSIVYVLQIPTQFKGEVVGKYLLKDTIGNVSETNFTASVNPNGSFNLGFEGGINPGSYVLVMCGGNK